MKTPKTKTLPAANTVVESVATERTEIDKRLAEHANVIFLQAVIAVKHLRGFTPFLAQLLPDAPTSKGARKYFDRVLDEARPSIAEDVEIAHLRERLAFAEEVAYVFFRRALTENFANAYGAGDFDREEDEYEGKPGRAPFTADVAYALEHATRAGLTIAQIRVGGRYSEHAFSDVR